MLRSLLAASLSASVLVSASLLPAPVQAAEEDPIAGARELYDRGTGKFETADYEGAIQLWTDAYSRVPTSPETIDIKILILYNLATAREKAFEVDGKLSHLRQALVLLEGFEKSIPSIYGEGEAADAEVARVVERKTKISAQIDAAEAAASEGEGKPDEPPPREPPREPTPPPGPLVIAGAALIGVGVAGLGVMTTGIVLGSRANDLSGIDPADVQGRRDLFDRGRLGNTLAIAGGAIAGVAVISGAVLLGLGVKGKKRPSDAGPAAAAAPWLAPGLAGVGVHGRF